MCWHTWLLTARPSFFISAFITCVTRAAQPPHELPALVADFNAPMLVAPAQTASQICPFDTLLHEQICATSASPSPPCPAFCFPPDSPTISTSLPLAPPPPLL